MGFRIVQGDAFGPAELRKVSQEGRPVIGVQTGTLHPRAQESIERLLRVGYCLTVCWVHIHLLAEDIDRTTATHLFVELDRGHVNVIHLNRAYLGGNNCPHRSSRHDGSTHDLVQFLLAHP